VRIEPQCQTFYILIFAWLARCPPKKQVPRFARHLIMLMVWTDCLSLLDAPEHAHPPFPF